MSLQGSFQTIALPDVMTLLASSSKTGELRVVSGHVEGRLWLHEGQLVQSGVGKAKGHVDAMFELLRLSDGNFVFRDGVEASEPDVATAVEPVVRLAQERLAEWQQIEAVVPSLEHRVRLVPELPASEVTLSAEDWKLVIAVALAGTVRGVVEELEVDYFDGCRGVKRLVDANLVLVESPRVRTTSESARPGRRGTTVVAAPEGPAGAAGADGADGAAVAAADRAERVGPREDKGFSSPDSLVASVSVTPSRLPSPLPSMEKLLASAAAAAVTASTLRASEPVAGAGGSDDLEEGGSDLAVVRHLFVNPPGSEPEPDLSWQSWNRAASESYQESEAPATTQASIRPIRPLPAGPTINAEMLSTLIGATGPSPLSPLVAPAAPLTTPLPRAPEFSSSGGPGLTKLSPLVSPAPSAAMPASAATAGHMAAASAPSAPSAPSA
ncbi:MAG: DUF4388 domain-containing protein, partial [Acidimicrobiales bacterium]